MTIGIIGLSITLAIRSKEQEVQAVTNSIKTRIITKVRTMKNNRKNENGIKKRKKNRRIKTSEIEKK